MDEANYMIDSNNRSVARQIYGAFKGSLKTRFPNYYKLLCISSDSLPTSFIREKISFVKQQLSIPNSMEGSTNV
jgi:hypothetical protein